MSTIFSNNCGLLTNNLSIQPYGFKDNKILSYLIYLWRAKSCEQHIVVLDFTTGHICSVLYILSDGISLVLPTFLTNWHSVKDIQCIYEVHFSWPAHFEFSKTSILHWYQASTKVNTYMKVWFISKHKVTHSDQKYNGIVLKNDQYQQWVEQT